MDASEASSPPLDTPTAHPVRIRLRRRIRLAIYCVVPATLICLLNSFSKDRADVGWVSSGPVQVVAVNEDASLTIAPMTQKNSKNSAEVHWLGIEIQQLDSTRRWLEDRLSGVDSLTLRFDRRRLDESGRLQAYFFRDETLLNAEIVKQGLAIDDTHPADFAAIARVIRQAERP